MLIDTGPIIAIFDKDDDYHQCCIEILKKITLFTLDHKDFRLYKPKHRKRFALIPSAL